jgi:hypothetical protein
VIALCLELLGEDGRELLLHRQLLIIGLEEERDREDVETLIDERETAGGEQASLQCVDRRPHHADVRRLVALRAAGVDLERHAAFGALVPRVAHVGERLVPCRVGRRLRAEADDNGCGEDMNGGADDEHESEQARERGHARELLHRGRDLATGDFVNKLST